MPNNTLLMIGIGLAAFTLFRREETDVGEEDLVNASMLASGTGETGKALGSIPTIAADIPIGGEPPEAQPMADMYMTPWMRTFFGLPPLAPTPKNGTVVASSNKDTELPNERTGADPEVNVTPFVQTPSYIRTTGEKAGEALRQIGIITHPGDVDLINPRIYVQEITTDDYSFGPLTGTEDVQIVAGGANPGDPYYTKLDVLAAYRDLGGFGPVPDQATTVTQTTESVTLTPDADARRVAAPDAEYSTGIPYVPLDQWADPFTGGNRLTPVPEDFDRETVSTGGYTHPDAFWLEG
jgi:hypothetical protein